MSMQWAGVLSQQGAGFDPEDLLLNDANVVGYLNAEDLSDGTITSWTDRVSALTTKATVEGSADYTGTQSSDSFVTSGVIDFTVGTGSVDTRIVCPEFDTDMTFVIRMQYISGTDPANVFTTIPSSGATAGFHHIVYSGDSFVTDVARCELIDGLGSGTGYFQSWTAEATDQWVTRFVQYDAAGSLIRCGSWLSSAFDWSAWTDTSGLTLTGGHGKTLRLGAYGDGYGANGGCLVKYVAVFSRLLTTDELTALGDYAGV